MLGAGASLAQASSLRPVRSLQHPPLDATFFSKALALGEKGEVGRAVRAFRTAVNESGSFNDPFALPHPPLEQFFADVYYEVARNRSAASEFRVFVKLLRLYARVLATTTNWLSGPRLGSLDRVIRRELELARSGGLTIISFNQDLLVEYIVARLPRIRPWCLEYLYGKPEFTPLYRRGNTERFSHCTADCEHAAPIRLLKLHGSLNWVLRSRDADPSRATLFPAQDRDVFVLDRKQTSDQSTYSRDGGGGRRSWYLWPLVVPPIYDKHLVTGMRFLESLWEQASAAITGARRVAIFGYSLPAADVSAIQLIRRAFIANASLSGIHCVNPDVDLPRRLRDHLDCAVVHWYEDATDYLASGLAARRGST